MTELVRHVPGVACSTCVREACARLHDLPGVRSVQVGETWTQLIVIVDEDVNGAEVRVAGRCACAGRHGARPP